MPVGRHELGLRQRVTDGSVAVLVIDVQNDFCHDDGTHGRCGADLRSVQRVTGPIMCLLDAVRPSGVPVIFARTHHDAWTDREGHYVRQTPRGSVHHLRPGGWGSEFYGIEPSPDDRVLVKHRYSAFFGTELDIVLRNIGAQCLLVAGVATNVCVDTTVRDACMRGYDPVVIEECVAAYSEEAHRAALDTIDRHFGAVAPLEAVTSAFAPSPDQP